MAKFTVDTHLFRELGELLVGRDSTALVELIKNAYDADATEVVVYGEALDDVRRGFMTISDNGIGMTSEEFTQGFLRVASRLKETGERLSKRYRRRYTGAKGIGRLAAHKLARFLQIHSVAWEENSTKAREAVDATIDWDLVEQQETLEDVGRTTAITVDTEPIAKSTRSGTFITLKRLRRRWSPAERARFLTEVETFDPPQVLIRLPRAVLRKPLLFEEPKRRDSSNIDPGFQIKLEGEFTPGEDYWQNLAQAVNWIIEIDARRQTLEDGHKIRYAIAPTRTTLTENPGAEAREFVIDHPEPENGPFFQARILVREGAVTKQIRSWAARASGIRVFLEGFRVLPYGEPRNDWLGIDADYTRRLRSLASITDFDKYFTDDIADRDAALLFLRNSSYFGGVFLTQANAPALRLLVNREGFVPDSSYDTLVDLVRKSVDLSVRVRASANLPRRLERKEQRGVGKKENGDGEVSISPIPTRRVLGEALMRAKAFTNEARQLAATGDVKAATQRLSDAIKEVERAVQTQDKLISEEAMLRVLASVGTQMAGFIHEINSLIGMSEAVDATLGRIREDRNLPREVKQELAKLHSAIGDLRRSLERQASYLVDVVTPDARRRRIRMSLADRFSAGARLVEHLANRRGIKIINEIPPELKSPPMFPAELTTVFSNLLSNAVKAAGKNGKIHASGSERADGSIAVVVENTGVAVDLADSERWFRPFESTTESVDPILGQGMGMGLPITRNMLEEYGATIKFVRPDKGYSTAVEITFSA